jgi:hypothetical protein
VQRRRGARHQLALRDPRDRHSERLAGVRERCAEMLAVRGVNQRMRSEDRGQRSAAPARRIENRSPACVVAGGGGALEQ